MVETVTLAVTNAVLGVGFGVPLAQRLAAGRGRAGIARWLAALAGIYLAECVAFPAGMGTNVWSFVLAVVWGLVMRWKLAARPPEDRRRLAVWFSLYTSLPAVSFASMIPVLVAGGWKLFSVEAGHRFGVPGFVPWPFCTMAGFFAALIGSAVVVKTVVTTAIVVARRKARAE
jgi:hypothetical protein